MEIRVINDQTDPYGHALMDYLVGDEDIYLTLHNSYGDPEEMPVAVFFRDYDELSELDQHALKLCKGKVLDVGCAVGAHSLPLQERGLEVDAMDLSGDACAIATMRGVEKVLNKDLFKIKDESYDTILLLMNGLGLSGKVKRLTSFLKHLKGLLNSSGQIIIDSSDLSYLYEDLKSDNTLGEIQYQYEYKGKKGAKFDWLYADQKTLRHHASKAGLSVDIAFEDDQDQYLAVLTFI